MPLLFGTIGSVILIPTARELSPEVKTDIWYSRSDLQKFQKELVTLLPSHISLKTNILALGTVAAFAGCDFSAPFAECEPLEVTCSSAMTADSSAAAPEAAVAVQEARACSKESTATTATATAALVMAAAAVIALDYSKQRAFAPAFASEQQQSFQL